MVVRSASRPGVLHGGCRVERVGGSVFDVRSRRYVRAVPSGRSRPGARDWGLGSVDALSVCVISWRCQAHCPSSESYRQAFQCPDMSLFFLPCVPVEDPRSFWAFQVADVGPRESASQR